MTKRFSVGMLAAVGLIACAGIADGTIKDACGIAPDAFKTWRETSLARRSGWYAKAEKSVPKLHSWEVKPVGLVKVQTDAAAFQGWRALPAGELSTAWGRPLNPGDSLTLDFGEHLVGYLSFSLVDTKRVIDAPVRLKFTFAEVPLELGEDARKIENLPTLSRSWLQHEVVTVDVVPSEVRLPRRYAFRYVKIEVVASPGGGRFGIGGVSATAVTSADASALRPWTAPSASLAKIDMVARRTLRDCMQTVFEDGPKRDRRLWLGDLRLEALANYETYGNFEIVKHSLYVLAGTADDDARISSDAYERPRIHRGECTILDYTALYAATVLEYLEASGDRETAEDLWPLCVRQLDFILDTIGADGVFRDNGKWWCFIDWQSKLNRQTPEQGALAYGFRQTLRLAKALGRTRDVAFLEDVLARMEEGAEERLWNEERGVYVCEKDGQASWMGQAWMVIGGLAKGERAKRCLQTVTADAASVGPVTPYANHYFTEALYTAGLRREAEKHLVGYWGGMAELGADTFWEVYVPGDQLASPYKTPLINSYCHAWSCAPAYFLRNAKFRAAPAQAPWHRLVLADESRPRLHYWDSADPSACFSIPGERPMWDLKRVGDMKYRAVCKKGFMVFDLRARKVVDEFRHPLLDEVTAVCDMPDGGFVASVNPRTGPDKNKVVLLVRFSADRKPVATYRGEGFFYARSLEWDRDGKTLLLSWEKGFARLRLPDAGNVCQVMGDFRQPKGRNLFDVVPLRSGDGYLAGCGYGGGLVHFGPDGKAVSTWFIPEQDGCRSLFYAQPKERPDGHVYMAHWTGHGANDSKHGWQVVEFDDEGRVVWHLHDPERFGSVSGLDVLE